MKKLTLLIGMLVCAFLFSYAQVTDAEKRVAQDLVQKNATVIGLTQDDLTNSIVTGTYIVPGSDVRMLYLQQSYKDIPVYNRLNVLAFRNDQMISKTGGRITEFGQKTFGINHIPTITPDMAVRAAMAECRVNTGRSIIPEKISANGQKLDYGNLNVSTENISAELIWFPAEDGNKITLTWQIFIAPSNVSDYWLIRVNAANGQIINKETLTVYCNWDKEDHSAKEKTLENKKINQPVYVIKKITTPKWQYKPFVVNNATYRVIKYPAESPQHPGGAHTTHTNPWTMVPGNATSLGWQYDGATYYDSTRGNNVFAYEDRDANNLPGRAALSTTAQPDLTFDFVPNYTLEPTVRTPAPNQQFNTTNLFYWNNLIHDISYIYGFTETARNFQSNNQGRGGSGADYVLAEAQDGSGTNNANFATPSEGNRPRMQMYLWTAPTPDKDGDVDNGIIVHEYTHGISNRLTGTGIGCLSNGEQMGEGWSDYFSLMLTHDWATALPGDGFSKPRGIGTYALNQPTTGVGIRQYRYTTDMSVNPLTYSNLPSVAHPHGTGTIWCTVLWDMTWAIIQSAGINPSLINIPGNGGNVIALKLVTEGLRLQPCSPGFIDGRNAILKADTMYFGAQYSCIIIDAFARRGMGIGASQGSANSRTDQTVSFTGCAAPPTCTAPLGLTSSSITSTSATVNWSAVSGAVSYDVDYKANSSSTWINAETGTTSTSVNLAGLTPSTLYDFRVRTNCPTLSSPYTQSQFTTTITAPTCTAPLGLTSSFITSISATVNWSSVSGAVSYDVDYKANSSSTWLVAAAGTTSTSVNLVGLTPSTLYDYRVRTNCPTLSSPYTQSQFTTGPVSSGCPGPQDVSTNGSTGGAANILLNTDVKGLINPTADNDYYRFHITTGGTISVVLSALPDNYELDLLNGAGTRIGRSKNGGTSDETINATVTTGDYFARVYPKGNASDASLCYNLRVNTGTASLVEEELITGKRINLFPNPASKTVTINIQEMQGPADIQFFDIYGRLVIQRSSNSATTSIDVSKLPIGVYMVKVKNDGKESNIKIIKE